MIPIAICSTKNAAQVMDFGAEQTFDYRDSDCASKIVGCTDIKNGYCAHADTLAYRSPTRRTILHTHSIASLPPSQPRYVSQHSDVRPTVKTDWVLGPSIFGQGSTWPVPYGRPDDEEIEQYGERLWSIAQKLVNEGKLQHHPLHILEGGIESVTDGLDLVRAGKLSGAKCVVKF
jgi:hypothetical protein